MFFGKKLKELRLNNVRMGLRKFASTIGITARELSEIERGLVPPPEDEDFINIIVHSLQISRRSKDCVELYDLYKSKFVKQEESEVLGKFVCDTSNVDNMEYKEKIALEKQLIKDWEWIEEKREALTNIIFQQSNFEEEDCLIMIHCLNIVNQYINLYHEEIDEFNIKSHSKNENLFDEMTREYKESIILKVMKEFESIFTMSAERYSIEERLNAIECLKMRLWKNLKEKKDSIEYILLKGLISEHVKHISYYDSSVALKCMSLVFMMMHLKEREISLLEQLDFS